MKALLIIIVIFIMAPLYASQKKLDGHEMSVSRLHLERIVTDTEDLERGIKRHEERSTLDINEDTKPHDNDMCELIAAIYFENENAPLRQYIIAHLRRKLLNARKSTDVQTKESVNALEFILQNHKKPNDLPKSVDMAKRQPPVKELVHSLVMEAIEDAFVEKDNDLEKRNRDKNQLELTLNASYKKTRIAAIGNIVTALASAGITTAVILGSVYGTK